MHAGVINDPNISAVARDNWRRELALGNEEYKRRWAPGIHDRCPPPFPARGVQPTFTSLIPGSLIRPAATTSPVNEIRAKPGVLQKPASAPEDQAVVAFNESRTRGPLEQAEVDALVDRQQASTVPRARAQEQALFTTRMAREHQVPTMTATSRPSQRPRTSPQRDRPSLLHSKSSIAR